MPYAFNMYKQPYRPTKKTCYLKLVPVNKFNSNLSTHPNKKPQISLPVASVIMIFKFYLAIFTALFSLITVTFIWPGNVISV